MAVVERTTWIDAPFETVWAFHTDVDSLVTVTPNWVHLRVEHVSGPARSSDPGALDVGSEVRLSVDPFGVGLRQYWTSRIVEREREDGRAFFTDRMVSGPLPTWEHTHRFHAEDGGTRLVDHVEYELPLGPLRSTSVAIEPVLEAVLDARHRRTREELER